MKKLRKSAFAREGEHECLVGKEGRVKEGGRKRVMKGKIGDRIGKLFIGDERRREGESVKKEKLERDQKEKRRGKKEEREGGKGRRGGGGGEGRSNSELHCY